MPSVVISRHTWTLYEDFINNQSNTAVQREDGSWKILVSQKMIDDMNGRRRPNESDDDILSRVYYEALQAPNWLVRLTSWTGLFIKH